MLTITRNVAEPFLTVTGETRTRNDFEPLRACPRDYSDVFRVRLINLRRRRRRRREDARRVRSIRDRRTVANERSNQQRTTRHPIIKKDCAFVYDSSGGWSRRSGGSGFTGARGTKSATGLKARLRSVVDCDSKCDGVDEQVYVSRG